MKISVIAAWPERILEQTLDVDEGTSIQDIGRHPELSEALKAAWNAAAEVGVFGERRRPTDTLRDGDRIELWRALDADPNEARRARARAKKKSGRFAPRKPSV